MKNGNSPAMPTHDVFQDCGFDGNSGPHLTQTTSYGLTKREMMAMHILSGMLSSENFNPTREQAASFAVGQADALLAELERTK